MTDLQESTLDETASPVEEEPVFEWGELPARSKRSAAGRAVSERWLKVANLLRDNTGEWAKVAEHDRDTTAANHAARVRNGKSRAFTPAKHFEATTRPLEGTRYAVWARHVGEQPAEQVANVDEVSASEVSE